MNQTTGNSQTHWDIIVIGGGQSGQATGYYLKQNHEDFVILNAHERPGDSWRKRWDSLRLFTPSQYDGLPGMPFDAKEGYFPTKNEMADYLDHYAGNFGLPVMNGVNVIRLKKVDDYFVVYSSIGELTANKVVIASGTHPMPKIPVFSSELNKDIHQIHSSQYVNPDQISAGPVLVVGAGTSGLEIAIEVSKKLPTSISGTPNFHIPDFIFNYMGSIFWWFASHVVTIQTPIGRKARKKILTHGGPLISISALDLDIAGVTRFPRVSGVKNGNPLFEDGREGSFATIIWATGFKPDFSWIREDVTNEHGWPLTNRGISKKADGLYFVGMPFQSGLTSGFVGGVGRDAAFIANQIHRRSLRSDNKS